MDDKVVIFGPWIGEFSYELGWWAPMLRKLKKEQFSTFRSIACGYEGREILYKDFVDEYLPYDFKTRENMGYPGTGGTADYETNTFRQKDPAAEEFLKNYIQTISCEYLRITPNNIRQYTNQGIMGPGDIKMHKPYGDYIHLNARLDFKNEINNLIAKKLENTKPTIAIMAKIRDRIQRIDLETLPLKTWEIFIEKIICDLDLNVIMIGVPFNKGYPGSYTLDNTKLFQNYPNNIISLVSEQKDSVEQQIAILQSTQCSIYGSTGAAKLAFFANTPMFCIAHQEQIPRYRFNWMLSLTNNHKKIGFYGMNSKQYPTMKPNDMFIAFNTFYKNKVKN